MKILTNHRLIIKEASAHQIVNLPSGIITIYSSVTERKKSECGSYFLFKKLAISYQRTRVHAKKFHSIPTPTKCAT